MERHLITRQGQQRLKEELDQLRKVELPRNVQAIAEARAHGDLSENAEFHAAKERQAVISAKLMELEVMLANVEVVDPLPEPDGRVVFGAVVKLYDPEADEEMTYQLVGPAESDASAGRISLTSPIGQALVGKEEGDEVRVKTPGGLRVLEILEVSAAD
ncbi:MAG: transcription elongation factor GreA [Desulfarculus sp.]|nr:transcription elongation factor GreA [Desulfarculus sp.]